jgi:4'-phosphopantetheinyl transferase
MVSQLPERMGDACLMSDIGWPAPPAHWFLNATDTHVWAASLLAPPGDLDKFAATLSPAEHLRADRFRSERDRHRFVVAHCFLRVLLGRYLDLDPSELHFSRGPCGKPVLAGAPAHSGLHFNLAHSEDMALLAFSRLGPVGIDLEWIRPLDDALELADRFFSPRESAELRQHPADLQPEVFFEFWTRKEAWLKATGEGIASSLHVPVPLASSRWHFLDLTPASGFAGALALDLRSSAFTSTDCSFGAPHPACWRWTAS